ncbi:MAG: hypothetical protein ABI439_02190 [Rhodospirillales bacterium]
MRRSATKRRHLVPRFRVNFLVGANVEAEDAPAAFLAAKRELERRYGGSILFAIEEQTFPPVIYRIEPPEKK